MQVMIPMSPIAAVDIFDWRQLAEFLGEVVEGLVQDRAAGWVPRLASIFRALSPLEFLFFEGGVLHETRVLLQEHFFPQSGPGARVGLGEQRQIKGLGGPRRATLSGVPLLVRLLELAARPEEGVVNYGCVP